MCNDQLDYAYYFNLYVSNSNLLVPPLTIDNDMVQFIELATRGQRLCPVWHDLHRGRITSSLFGQVLKAGRNPNSLVKHIIEGSGLNK